MLAFDVTGQSIRRTDNNVVAAGARNYPKAHFTLSPEWDGVKVAAQFIVCDKAYAVWLDDDNTCTVPWEAIQKPGCVKVTVYGGDLITTNWARVHVQESGYGMEDCPSNPTPSLFADAIKRTEAAADRAEAAGLSPVDATADMTQPVGKDADGGLWTTANIRRFWA